MNAPRPAQARHWATSVMPWLVLIIGLSVTWRLSVFELHEMEDVDRDRFNNAATELARSIESELRRYTQALMGMRDWYAAEPVMSDQKWTNRVYTLHVPAHYPALFNVGFAEMVMDVDVVPLTPHLDKHLRTMRKRLGPSYALTLPSAGVEGYSWYHIPVIWHSFGQRRIDPVRPYRHYGMDLNQDPDLWASMNWALGQDVPALSGKQLLDPDNPEVRGFMVFLPVYSETFYHEVNNATAERFFINAKTPEEKEAAIRVARVDTWLRITRGLIFGGIDMRVFFEHQLGTNAPIIQLACYGSTNLSASLAPSQVVFDNRRNAPPVPAHLRSSRSLNLFGRSITLIMEAGPGFKPNAGRRAVMWAAFFGVGATLILCRFIIHQTKAYRREQLVSEQLRQSEAKLQSLLHARARISRDLHDGTIQSLYAIGLGLTQLRRTLENPAQSDRLGGSLTALDQVVTDLRGYLTELDPGVSPAQSPTQALSELIAGLHRATATELRLEIDPAIGANWPPSAVLDLLQMVREGISNAQRHGEATKVDITLKRGDHAQVVLTLSDNGKGFDPTRQHHHGHGLANLRLRAEAWGGRVHVDSRIGGPSRVVVSFTPTESTKHQTKP